MQNKNKSNHTPKEEETSSRKKEEEFGGQKGPEPTRYGDWEKAGRVSDF